MAEKNEEKKSVESTTESDAFSSTISGASTATISTFVNATTNVDAVVTGSNVLTDSSRAKTLRWISEHRDELQKYSGQWVALKDEKVLGAAKTMLKALALAEDLGARSPIVIFIDAADLDPRDA